VKADDFSSKDWELQCRRKASSNSNAQPVQRHQSSLLPLFFQNAGQAHSADSFVFLDPPLLLQDKQSHTSKRAVQLCGRHPPSSSSITVADIVLEHDKCNPPTPHLFVYITDEFVSQEVVEEVSRTQGHNNNVVIIHRGNEEEFFGPFLTRSKLYHDQEENISRGDPTPSLERMLYKPSDTASGEESKRRRTQHEDGAWEEEDMQEEKG
jgi:hypothetical protein